MTSSTTPGVHVGPHDTPTHLIRAPDNEEQSAALFQTFASEMALPQSLTARVVELILMTKHHVEVACTDQNSLDAALFLDMDMSILGADKDVYDAYARDIRREYIHVPEAAFCAGRAAVLRRFLSHPCIFSSTVMADQFESKARANIAREIARLESGSS